MSKHITHLSFSRLKELNHSPLALQRYLQKTRVATKAMDEGTLLDVLLFTPDNRQQLYEPLTQPVLVIYDEDAYTRFDHLPAHLAAHDNWQAERIVPTRGLAHYERPEKTAEAMERFWSGLE